METVRFRLTDDLEKAIEARNDYEDENSIARRDLQRYYLLMQHTPLPLAPNEFQACVAAYRSILFDANWSIRYFHYGIIDACDLENLHENYGLDRDAFIAKIQSLSLFERCVVVDAIERERVRLRIAADNDITDAVREGREERLAALDEKFSQEFSSQSPADRDGEVL